MKAIVLTGPVHSNFYGKVAEEVDILLLPSNLIKVDQQILQCTKFGSKPRLFGK